jgi:hypothetical protein
MKPCSGLPQEEGDVSYEPVAYIIMYNTGLSKLGKMDKDYFCALNTTCL